MAIALKMGLIKNIEFTLGVIDAAIRAISKIVSSNGSLEEAYPNEKSFCVTALVAYDVLSTIDHLGASICEEDRETYLRIIQPLIKFIIRSDETHAVISNHLATAVAAIDLWNRHSGEGSQRGEDLLKLIYQHQSSEGWYLEYEGADPGYQSLCISFLSAIYQMRHDPGLLESLDKSASFLKYFIQPDGTIGGLYGSRNTEVYYPAGIISLASVSTQFAQIARLLHEGVCRKNHIFPEDIDTGNFIPLLNSYATAAMYFDQNQEAIEQSSGSPPHQQKFSMNFHDAGIYIHSNSKFYAIVNYKKGGTLKVFDKSCGCLDIEDGGLFGILRNGQRFSTQHYNHKCVFDQNIVTANFYLVIEKYQEPLTTILLRLMGLTLFKIGSIGMLFKKLIVRRLFTGGHKIDGQLVRYFEFSDDQIIIRENLDRPKNTAQIGHYGKSKAMQMASSGYYLPQLMDVSKTSKLVTFKQKELNPSP